MKKNLGIGIGLRIPHYEAIFTHWPEVDWFEIISENFMVDGGKPLANLHKILEKYTVVQHGVSLGIGSATPLDFEYLKRLKALTKITKTPWVSDHLCWGQTPGGHYHDLLPLPYTKDVVNYVAERARIIQDYLELPLALENLSSYVTYTASAMPEWEFVSSIIEKANIHLLLDVNNVYVSSVNHDFDPMEYLKNVPLDKVIQMHVAGHKECGDYLLDTHDHPVKQTVWELYRHVYMKTGGVSTLLEWDANFLSFEETWAHAKEAKKYQQKLI